MSSHDDEGEDQARAARAAQRRSRTILHKTTLGDARTDVVPVHGALAIALAARLSRTCWSLAGRGLPTYARADIPIAFVPRARDEHAVTGGRDTADVAAMSVKKDG